MEVKYNIIYLQEVIDSHIPTLSSSAKKLVKRAIEERLVLDPISFGKPLKYSMKGHRRLRVGDYRVIYRIMHDVVSIIAIKHRSIAYD